MLEEYDEDGKAIPHTLRDYFRYSGDCTIHYDGNEVVLIEGELGWIFDRTEFDRAMKHKVTADDDRWATFRGLVDEIPVSSDRGHRARARFEAEYGLNYCLWE